MASRLAGPLACVLANEVFAARRLEEALARLVNSGRPSRRAARLQANIHAVVAYGERALPQQVCSSAFQGRRFTGLRS